MSIADLSTDLFNLIMLNFTSHESHSLKYTSKIFLVKVLEFEESDVCWNRNLFLKYNIRPVVNPKSLYIMVNNTRHNHGGYVSNGSWLLKDCIEYSSYDYFDALFEARLITCEDIYSKVNYSGIVNRKFLNKPIGSYILSKAWPEIEEDEDRNLPQLLALKCKKLTEKERESIFESLKGKHHRIKFTKELFHHFTFDEVLSIAFENKNYCLLEDLFMYDKSLIEKHKKFIIQNVDYLCRTNEITPLVKDTVRKFNDCLLKYRAEFCIAILDKDPDIKRFDSPKLIRACKRYGPLHFYSPKKFSCFLV